MECNEEGLQRNSLLPCRIYFISIEELYDPSFCVGVFPWWRPHAPARGAVGTPTRGFGSITASDGMDVLFDYLQWWGNDDRHVCCRLRTSCGYYSIVCDTNWTRCCLTGLVRGGASWVSDPLTIPLFKEVCIVCYFVHWDGIRRPPGEGQTWHPPLYEKDTRQVNLGFLPSHVSSMRNKTWEYIRISGWIHWDLTVNVIIIDIFTVLISLHSISYQLVAYRCHIISQLDEIEHCSYVWPQFGDRVINLQLRRWM